MGKQCLSLLSKYRRAGYRVSGLALLLVASWVPAFAQNGDPPPTAEALGLARLTPPYVISK